MKYRTSTRRFEVKNPHAFAAALEALYGDVDRAKETAAFFIDWGYPYFNRGCMTMHTTAEGAPVIAASYWDTNNRAKRWTIVASWDGDDFVM